MNRWDVIKLLAGPIIGAAIAIVAIWAKELFEQNKSIQTWFEEHYIFQGVDLLIAHFILLESLMVDYQHIEETRIPRMLSNAPDELSPDVIAKLQAILNSRIFFISAAFMRHIALTEFDDQVLKKHALAQCLLLAKVYNAILIDLRKQLLKIRLKHKTDVYDILENNPSVASLLDRMNAAHVKTATKLEIDFRVDEKGHLR